MLYAKSSAVPRRHCEDVAFRGEDEYLACKEVQFYCVKEVHGIRLRVVEDFLYRAQPVVELSVALVFRAAGAVFVFPVCGKALLCHFVHMVGAYLHFYPASGV